MASASVEVARANERRVYLLRAEGATFEEIAAEVGYRDRAAAHKAWKRYVARVESTADRSEHVQIELARLDALHRALWPAAKRGDVAAVDRCLKIAERRAKLLGLDADPQAPSKVPAGDAGASTDPVDQIAQRRAQRRSTA